MTISITWHNAIREIEKEDWNRLALPLPYPFLEWELLAALEDTGCVRPEVGWQPIHLTVCRGEHLIAAAALYLKGNSRGEFVFDQDWAEASASLGLRYYPKLLGMSPFTPAPGYRFLIDPDEDPVQICQLMMEQINAFCKKKGIPGCHFLHTDPEWAEWMMDAGMKPWKHHHLIWENNNLPDFDAYLALFNSKQRKNIKRERRLVAEQGIEMRMIPGEEAGEELFAFMYELYANTCQKFWNWSHYLDRAFFMELARNYAHRVMFSAAFQKGQSGMPVAMSFLIYKGQIMHGRYWGCLDQFDQLHFETCYYQPIEWAIKKGLRFFDAGSGNARHKQKRGFPARPNLSLHNHYHPTMRQLWEDNIETINSVEMERIRLINREL